MHHGTVNAELFPPDISTGMKDESPQLLETLLAESPQLPAPCRFAPAGILGLAQSYALL